MAADQTRVPKALPSGLCSAKTWSRTCDLLLRRSDPGDEEPSEARAAAPRCAGVHTAAASATGPDRPPAAETVQPLRDGIPCDAPPEDRDVHDGQPHPSPLRSPFVPITVALRISRALSHCVCSSMHIARSDERSELQTTPTHSSGSPFPPPRLPPHFIDLRSRAFILQGQVSKSEVPGHRDATAIVVVDVNPIRTATDHDVVAYHGSYGRAVRIEDRRFRRWGPNGLDCG